MSRKSSAQSIYRSDHSSGATGTIWVVGLLAGSCADALARACTGAGIDLPGVVGAAVSSAAEGKAVRGGVAVAVAVVAGRGVFPVMSVPLTVGVTGRTFGSGVRGAT